MSKSQILVTLIFACLIGAATSLAHEGATGIVKKRMDMMKGMGKQMKALHAMVSGKTPYDAGAVQKSAQEMKEHAGHIQHMFPEGSNEKPSAALPAIWQDWEKFVENSKALATAAEALAESSRSIDDAKKAFPTLAKTCKSCHQDFRQKKK